MSGFKRLIKNSVSNIINGFSNVILGIVISPALLHNLSKIDFSIWSLTLQVGIFIGIIGIGIQVTVGRFVAFHSSDIEKRQRTVQQSLFFVTLLGLVCMALILVMAKYFFSFFPEVSETDANTKLVFVLICGSFVLNNISAPFVGYFTGIERNDLTASVNVIFKVLLGFAIYFVIDYGLDVIAWVYFAINAFNQISLFVLYKLKSRHEKIKTTFDKSIFKTVVVFFSGLLIWNIAQFLISGIGTFTVGKFAFSELAGFAVLMTLVNTGVGILGALINPIIQPMLRMYNAGNDHHIELLVNKLVLLFALFTFVSVFIAWFMSIHILGVWLGYEQAEKLHIMFTVLLTSYLIRMIAAPYGLMLVAYGEQLSIAYLPIVEGILNFALSVYFVRHYGAVGIAYSTFISGVLIMCVYACKFRAEAVSKSNQIFIAFIGIPVLIATGLGALLISDNGTTQIIIYVIESVCAVLAIIYSLKLLRNIKSLLNNY
ncbi:oligosaccharide flippase family protein [Enterobacter sp. 638]|uniref:Polysaccharide biosynthesis protein n=1 Tax=Enterobacter sp. (strain 638) TaxID=399742 RepID=A0A9J9GHU9_ENT38|nr:oligosaccharide flippase family protein [Enterobacter sp. 638]ABP61316.1 polysaccharide biosynthesis protein [Enterobacter sp. 638]